MEDLSKKNKEAEKQRAIFEVAKKVSHDIRSPLSALNIISSRISNTLPEEGDLLKMASQQIFKIAEDLLDANRQSSKKESAPSDDSQKSEREEKTEDLPVMSAIELAAICREVVALKEVEYKDTSKARLSFYDSISTQRKAKVDSHQLKRILSNLLNNAIESISDRGFVTLNIEENSSYFIFELRDSGKGMSRDLIEKAYRQPVTEGKERGNGLGLHNSIKTIQSWGGKVDIASTPNIGTTITIQLPLLDN